MIVLALSLLLAGPSAATEVQVPRAVIERFVDTAVHRVRVTMFDNQVVVVSAREGETQVVFRKATLSVAEYGVYLEAIRREVKGLRRPGKTSSIRTVRSKGRLIVEIDPGDVIDVHYSPIQVLEQPLARLNALVDDLQRRVTQDETDEGKLGEWLPKLGDRVELLMGDFAVVVEIQLSDTVVLQHEATGVFQVVSRDSRTRVIRRVVEEEP